MTNKLGTIMLVDDNLADNFLHERVLRESGSADQVVSYLDAAEALRDIAEHRVVPDLIFLDINMPGVNGWDFIDTLKTQPHAPRPPFVIMLTTSLHPDDRARAEGDPALSGLYNKPLTAELARSIIDHIAGRSPPN